MRKAIVMMVLLLAVPAVPAVAQEKEEDDWIWTNRDARRWIVEEHRDVWIPTPMAPRVPRQPPPGEVWQPNDQPRTQYLPVYPAPVQPGWGQTWPTK